MAENWSKTVIAESKAAASAAVAGAQELPDAARRVAIAALALLPDNGAQVTVKVYGVQGDAGEASRVLLDIGMAAVPLPAAPAVGSEPA